MAGLMNPQEFVSFYMLFARTRSEVGAYIGATKDPFRRMSEHLLNTRDPFIPRYSSSDLVKWAKKHHRQNIQVVFLEVGMFDRHTRLNVEGAWIAAAKQAGFKLPGVDRWGSMSSGKEKRTLGGIEDHLDTAPILRELFTGINECSLTPSAFNRAMQFAVKLD